MKMKDKLRLCMCVQFSLIVAILLLTQLAQIVYAPSNYRLRISTIGGTSEQDLNGVDIVVLNQDDSTVKTREFLSLPPSSVYFIYDFLPEGSNLRVCALFHATTSIINCKDIIAGSQGSAEFVTLNLSPGSGF
jgi:hypothetical protein